MEGISKQELIRVKENMPDGTSKLFVHTLITMCKELPDGQWQTIDEFNGGEEYQWLWVRLKTDLVDMAYFADGKFYFNDMSDEHNEDEIWDIKNITHVMTIKAPESPK